MGCELVTSFVNIPFAAPVVQQARRHLAALDAAGGVCHLHVEGQRRHHAPGQMVRVSVELEPAGPQPRARAAQATHEELATAIDMAFACLVRRLHPAGTADAHAGGPRILGGHVVRVSPEEGTGTLALDGDGLIPFQRQDVPDHDLARLHVGDRAWWIRPEAGAAGGRLACMARPDRAPDHGPQG